MGHQPISGKEQHKTNGVKDFLVFLVANGGGFATIDGDGFEPFDEKVLNEAERAKFITRTISKRSAWQAYRLTKAGYECIGITPPSRWAMLRVIVRRMLVWHS